MKKIIASSFLPAMILASGIFASAVIVVRAQTPEITYPIAELGSCTDQAACRAYCADTAHITECTNFGEAHNLISPDVAARSRKFADVLRGEGPGGCKDEKSCRTYCADVSHLQACTAFAETHGIASGAELGEMKRIQAALQAGATMPGGCKTKDQCEAYCSGGQHADECLAFAEKAGTLSPEELANARKMTAFVKNGETPGKCTSKDTCENYCKAADHFNECIAFAEKAGLISPEDLAIAKKTGGKGPGGCSSKDACDAYCNASEHADECFAFAQDHGIIPPEKIKEIKDGMGFLRTGIAQAPEEVKACLREKLGENVIGKMQSGELTPTQQVGETVKACFESQMGKVKDKLEQGLKMAPPAVMNCIEQNVGTIDLQKIRAGEAPSPEKGDALRACFESMAQQGAARIQGAFANLPPGAEQCLIDKLGTDTVAQLKAGQGAAATPAVGEAMQECVKNAAGEIQTRMPQMPPAIQECVRAKIGDISNLQQPPDNLQEVIQGCAVQYKPVVPPMTEGPGIAPVPPIPQRTLVPGIPAMPQFAPQTESCLKSAYGEDLLDKIKSGEAQPPSSFSDTVRKCMMQNIPTAVPGGVPGMMPGSIPTPPQF